MCQTSRDVTVLRLQSVQARQKNVEEAIQRVSTLLANHERSLLDIRRTSGDGLSGVRHEYKCLEVRLPFHLLYILQL